MIGGSHAFRITRGQFRFPNLRSDSCSPALTVSDLQPALTSFPATHPQNSPVTPFAATHTNSPSCKSFPCHTYKKQGVSPLGVRPSCCCFHGRQHRAPISYLG